MKSKERNSDSTPSSEPPPRNEREFLERREATAKAALSATLKETGRSLMQLLDPRDSIREHPWKSSGIAILAGFFVGLKVTSSDPEKAEPRPKEDRKEAAGPSPWESLTSTLFETGSTALQSALAPWLAQKIQDLMPKGEAKTEAPQPEVKAEEAPSSP